MTNDPWSNLTQQKVTELLITWLRNLNYGMRSQYGYEIYLPSLAFEYLEKLGGFTNDPQNYFKQYSSMFYNAAWELCRRGILRPGITEYMAQATDDGASGNGYSITPYGRQWLAEDDHQDFVPTEPEAFGEIISKYKELFGAGFHQRSQEAIRCYGAHAYLSCCVMCGAAAESIMLNLAIKKNDDEKSILKSYRAANGRSNIENIILSNASKFVKARFNNINDLLKFWRDESAHGVTSQITEEEAFTAISLLLRICQISEKHYNELTQPAAR